MPTKYIFENSLVNIDEIKSIDVPEFIYSGGQDNFKERKSSPLSANAACLCVKIIKEHITDDYSDHYLKLICCIYSEISAIMESSETHLFTQYESDFLVSFYNTRFKINIEELIDIAAKISSLTEVINKSFYDLKDQMVRCQIGIDYNTTYFIDGSYSRNMSHMLALGPSRRHATDLLDKAISSKKDIIISATIYKNLSDRYKNFFSIDIANQFYSANLVNTAIDKWLQKE